jgi:predicted dehydrogenase
MSEGTVRVGMIGARRARQGLGPFVARDLRACGAEVACVLGTSTSSAHAAARELSAQLGCDVRAYADLDAMLEREPLDALAILSPHESHEKFLSRAVEARLHVLCEKPLLYGGTDLAGRAARIAGAFRAARLLLAENTQWPRTLEGYERLYPGSLAKRPDRFEMRLSPITDGVPMFADCLSHPLSVLQAVAPAPSVRLERIEVEYGAGDARAHPRVPARLRLAFDYVAEAFRVQVGVALVQSFAQPHAAALALDGRWAEREVRSPGYEIYFRAGERAVPLRDPLSLHVQAFVSELEAVRSGADPGSPEPIVQRMELFEELLGACRASGIELAGAGPASGTA